MRIGFARWYVLEEVTYGACLAGGHVQLEYM